VAARWRGVGDFLATTGAFEDLPPAAVAVRDRYLAYAAATGCARSAVRPLSPLWDGPAAPLPAAPAGGPPHPLPAGRAPRLRDDDRLLDAVRAGLEVRIGDVTVDGDEVVTPAFRVPRAAVEWRVDERRRTVNRFDPFALALVVGFMCLFPLNLFAALLAVTRVEGGEFVITVSAGAATHTSTVRFAGPDERAAVHRSLVAAGAEPEPA
jgi:hypothetical protein